MNKYTRQIKNTIRKIIPNKSAVARDISIIEEILKLNIKSISIEEECIVTLENGLSFTTFISDDNTFRHLHDLLSKEKKKEFELNSIKCLKDIVMRYNYPHMDLISVPPFPFETRKLWHKQHYEQIDDFQVTEGEKRFLKEIFSFREGDCILDLGAHTGFGSLAISQRIGRSGKIASVEADPICFSYLKKNVSNNNSKNIIPLQYAIWNEEKEIEFFKSSFQSNSIISSTIGKNASSVKVKSISIDELFNILGWKKIDYISLTINGSEIEALEGAHQVLAAFPNLKLNICGWYERDNQKIHKTIVPFLEKKGFRCYTGHEGRVLAYKKN